MSLVIVIIGILLIIAAYWIEHNPNSDIVEKHGLLGISGVLFWVGVLIFVIPIVIFGILFGGMALLVRD